jgi:toxin ParE1/3/4
MPPRIIRSDPANKDLEEIWDYLAVEASPEVADRVISRIFDAMRRASKNPLLYRERREFRDHPRRINVFGYAIFYEPLPAEDGIFIWRVIHSRRDLPNYLGRPAMPDEH